MRKSGEVFPITTYGGISFNMNSIQIMLPWTQANLFSVPEHNRA